MADNSNLLVQGFLTKQGQLHRSWKKRWFCNTTDELFILKYYTDETCSNKKGQIDLREVFNFRTKADTKERGPKQRVGFALVTPGRTWKLIAVGSSSGDYWSSGLDRLIQKARQQAGAGAAMAAPAVPTAPAAATASAAAAAPAPLKPPPALAAPPVSASAQAAPAPKEEAKHDDDLDKELDKDMLSAPPAALEANPPTSPPAENKRESKIAGKSKIMATAQYSYTAANPNELSFEAGDKLIVLQRDDDAGWWAAELNGKRGWVSSFYLLIDETN